MSVTFISMYLVGLTVASYIRDEAFMKPKLEKNNIVNKGVWIKRTDDDKPSKTLSGDFIFRSGSLDADSLLHNNFDPFGDNFARDSLMVPNYVERSKRSANGKALVIYKLLPCPACKACAAVIDYCRQFSYESKETRNMTNFPVRKQISDKSTFIKSKLLNKIRPETVINDYPYEVAILLSNSNKGEIMRPRDISPKDLYDTIPLNQSKSTSDPSLNMDKTETNLQKLENNNITYRNATNVTPKRSMPNEYESEIIKKIDFNDEGNKTEDSYETNKMDRNVFENEDRAWHQAAPIPESNNYKILPKTDDNKNKNKPITEKGLVKVLSMLTKTFKKVMKQHNDIKKIHTKLSSINDEFMKNAQLLMTKFQDFDVKYLYLMKFNENLKDLEAKLRNKEEFFNNKEIELTKNLAEFEKQQKKFLVQQQQFYNIQKLMLAQNEKINLKQNLIAKTQNEISLRQNNFARILKKAKQIYVDTKNPIPQKLSAILSKPKEGTDTRHHEIEKTTTTTQTPNTESIKINLFSVPSMSRIVNYDSQLLKEKDDHPVDDLIYKYYFNNTYIDVLMKNKFLASFAAPPDVSLARNLKSKRNENPQFVKKNTKLIPVNNFKNIKHLGNSGIQLNRGKRWIKYSKKNTKRKHFGKDVNVTAKKQNVGSNSYKNNLPIDEQISKKTLQIKSRKTENDPFWVMATSFCKGIGQDENEQMLHWCVEKALRRLRSIDMKVLQSTIAAEPTENTEIAKTDYTIEQTAPHITLKTTEMSTTSEETFPTTTLTSLSSPETMPAYTVDLDTTDSVKFFPDNDQLESNLKEYELKPDTEGTVYYEGSVHASQFEGPESDGASDMLPGLDSDSRVDIDPKALDLQQKRRAYVRRINADIMRQMKSG